MDPFSQLQPFEAELDIHHRGATPWYPGTEWSFQNSNDGDHDLMSMMAALNGQSEADRSEDRDLSFSTLGWPIPDLQMQHESQLDDERFIQNILGRLAATEAGHQVPISESARYYSEQGVKMETDLYSGFEDWLLQNDSELGLMSRDDNLRCPNSSRFFVQSQMLSFFEFQMGAAVENYPTLEELRSELERQGQACSKADNYQSLEDLRSNMARQCQVGAEADNHTTVENQYHVPGSQYQSRVSDLHWNAATDVRYLLPRRHQSREKLKVVKPPSKLKVVRAVKPPPQANCIKPISDWGTRGQNSKGGSWVHLEEQLAEQGGYATLPSVVERKPKKWVVTKYKPAVMCALRGQYIEKPTTGKHSKKDRDTLQKWFSDHRDWPYPSEDQKQELTRQTELDTKQLNNWFINHRKRHWDPSPKHEPNSTPFQQNEVVYKPLHSVDEIL